MPISQNDLDDRFGFHPATPQTGPKHDEVRRLARTFANALVDLTPESREQSMAITFVQEAMWAANAAIAVHTPPSTP